jgi:hypothetical protein
MHEEVKAEPTLMYISYVTGLALNAAVARHFVMLFIALCWLNPPSEHWSLTGMAAGKITHKAWIPIIFSSLHTVSMLLVYHHAEQLIIFYLYSSK